MAKITKSAARKSTKSKAKPKRTSATRRRSTAAAAGHLCVLYKVATFPGPPAYCYYYAQQCPATPMSHTSTNTNLPQPNDGHCGQSSPGSPNCIPLGFLIGHGRGHVQQSLKNNGIRERILEGDSPQTHNNSHVARSYLVDIHLNESGSRKIRAKLFDVDFPATGKDPAQTFYKGVDTVPASAKPADGTITFEDVQLDGRVCYAMRNGHEYTVILHRGS